MVSTFTSAISPRKKLKFYSKGKSISSSHYYLISGYLAAELNVYLLATY